MMRIVIVGGGFGGLRAARGLAAWRGAEVTLVDRRNHLLFQPLLYQVAMAGLSPADICQPIRSLLSRHRNVRVRQENVRSVDVARWRVITDTAELEYDRLVLACGVEGTYFGHSEMGAARAGAQVRGPGAGKSAAGCWRPTSGPRSRAIRRSGRRC